MVRRRYVLKIALTLISGLLGALTTLFLNKKVEEHKEVPFCKCPTVMEDREDVLVFMDNKYYEILEPVPVLVERLVYKDKQIDTITIELKPGQKYRAAPSQGTGCGYICDNEYTHVYGWQGDTQK
jgi:hypothetical protein